MTTTYSHSALAPRSPFGLAVLLEPLLVVGVSAFWLVTLPFVAASLFCVKAWDTIACRANPLILRRGPASKGVAASEHRTGSASAAHV